MQKMQKMFPENSQKELFMYKLINGKRNVLFLTSKMSKPIELPASDTTTDGNDVVNYESLSKIQKQAYVATQMAKMHAILSSKQQNDFVTLSLLCQWDACKQNSFHVIDRVTLRKEEYDLFRAFAGNILETFPSQDISITAASKQHFSVSFRSTGSGSSDMRCVIPPVTEVFAFYENNPGFPSEPFELLLSKDDVKLIDNIIMEISDDSTPFDPLEAFEEAMSTFSRYKYFFEE